jgi:hypothetical protein
MSMDFTDEFAQHPLGDLKICNHAIPHRANGAYIAMRAPEHLLRLVAYGNDLLGIPVERHNGGFVQNDALPLHVNESVRGAKVNGQVGGKE